MILPGKGSPVVGSLTQSALGRRKSDRSPVRHAAGATLALAGPGVALLGTARNRRRRTALFLMTGPPKVPPNMLRLNSALLLVACAIGKEAVSIQLVIPQELEDIAVELVRAALQRRVDDRAANVAELGRTVAGDDLALPRSASTFG